ncbi:MAG: replication-associated recombination protein A [Pseudomonadota bacterium]
MKASDPGSDLFAGDADGAGAPLAARLRPRSLDEYVGQEHLVGSGKPLRKAVESGHLHSLILWGPPGVGKTTLARLLARSVDARFESLSAVLAGVKDIREVVDRARAALGQGRRTVLFVDEVHRFNKSQQDAFLPHLEDGLLTFIGATTENPSFELNGALLSRARVYVLKPIPEEALAALLQRALQDAARGLGGQGLTVAHDARERLLAAADGDARRLLNLLEIAADLAEPDAGGRRLIAAGTLEEVLRTGTRRFDKGGDAFYDQISALHKSVRGSSPDAALYWLARMVDGGCDPLYVARRVVRMASEDVGNADPRALDVAMAAWDVQERLGSPEGELAIAQAVVYLAVAPKSNAVYQAWNAATDYVKSRGSEEVPMHIRNAPTKLMGELGHGAGYRYAHDYPGAYVPGENYLPEASRDARFYRPTDRGLEQRIAEKMAQWAALDRAADWHRYPVRRGGRKMGGDGEGDA